ncbi:hypothetical protein CVT24_006889 [Panaeolus cyanescens]|uniref:Uncharacterized protein n=1 Tax=Panaeolus cyanescens TaxID=181874 RepID=A0A409W074_9AGAR|nr:hypothetical protein CVT24_006889 [Panaeolus cyanescens]
MPTATHSRQFSVGLKYGIPIFLEDRSGSLSGSDFIDIHDRMRLIYRRRRRDTDTDQPYPYVYEIFDATSNSVDAFNVPIATLTFGANNELGTVTLKGSQPMTMDSYLSQVNEIAGSKLRRFFASDGNEYRWGYRVTDDNEWTVSVLIYSLLLFFSSSARYLSLVVNHATNSAGEIVAYYSLKSPGEPQYPGSSGCMLSVEESWGHLAGGELLN